MKPQAILFDLDGTLVDTEPLSAASVMSFYASWGVALPPELAARVAGRTWEAALAEVFAAYPPAIPANEAFARILADYASRISRGVPVVAGSPRAVRELAAVAKLGLVSGSRREEIRIALDALGLRDRFAVILGSEDYARSKPAPDGYAKAILSLGVDPTETLVFEDSAAGINAALAAGARVVAVTGTSMAAPPEAIAEAGKTGRLLASIVDFREVGRRWLAGL